MTTFPWGITAPRCIIKTFIEPLPPAGAKKGIRYILRKGTVTYSQPHALERMEQRNISMLDCVNVLRGGIVTQGEYLNGSWRYRVYTQKISVVIRFESDSEIEVVTAWREKA
jgi:hypothetical protein